MSKLTSERRTCSACNEPIYSKYSNCPACGLRINNDEEILQIIIDSVPGEGKGVFSKSDIRFLKTQEKDVISAAILLMCYTGISANELMQIKKNDINFDEMIFKVKGCNGSPFIYRTLPIYGIIQPILLFLYWNASVKEWDCIIKNDMDFKTFERKFKTKMAVLGKRRNIEDCRQYFMDICNNAGIDGDVIDLYLGKSGNIDLNIARNEMERL